MKVCESFRSLQGEGKKIGVPTYFIRTVGCNLQCLWCDTQYASSEEGKELSIDEIMELVKDEKDVCLTGGEPMLQKDTLELLKRLSEVGKTVVLETNGSISIKDVVYDNVIISMDIKCPYSGMHEKMDFGNIALLKEKDQLKFVISDGADLEYALTHEHCHIRRGDPWWRLLGWLILCVHWFDPLCWLGFFFMGRDMEQSCDEAVLEHLGDVRREYSESLLRIAGKSRLSSPAPLAFGESGVGSRVRNVLRWKKARKWVTVTAILLCLLFVAACATDPAALVQETVTLNPDGTIGNLQWGMSPEEALTADSRITRVDFDNPAWEYLILKGVNILGYTGDIQLNFPKYTLENDLRMDEYGTPFLTEIRIMLPGEIDLTEALVSLYGEQEKHPINFNHDPEIVDGIMRPYFDPRELSEDRWYWHSDETILDITPMEQLRISYPDFDDNWLQRAWCDTFIWRVDEGKEETEDGTVTYVVITGKGSAMQRFLAAEYAGKTEEK